MAQQQRNALVLGGGAIRGAFQAGALKYILDEYGFQPAFIYGISVGALNGAFIADRAGRYPEDIDWPQIGHELWQFWEQRIREPRDILKQRFPLSLLLDLLLKRFKGIVDPEPLQNLIRETVLPENLKNLRKKKVMLAVGAVDVLKGKIDYVSTADVRFLDRAADYIIASASQPIVMPPWSIGQIPYYDGGLIDVAPLGNAIKAGANRILCVACQPEQLVDHSDEPTSLKTGNMAKLFERISEILTNEMLENALALACQLNEVIKLRDQVALQARGESARFEQIVLTTIRPARASQVDVDVLKFKTKDVVGMLEAGYESARMALEDRPAETISSEAPPAWSAESVPVI